MHVHIYLYTYIIYIYIYVHGGMEILPSMMNSRCQKKHKKTSFFITGIRIHQPVNLDAFLTCFFFVSVAHFEFQMFNSGSMFLRKQLPLLYGV